MSTKPDPTLGAVLDSARRKAGYSLRQLAAVTGMPASRINRILKDNVEHPAPVSLVRLAGALGLSPARLFKLAGHPYPDLADLLRSDHGLSAEATAEIVKTIDRGGQEESS